MPQRDGPRLTGRNGEIWRRYIEGQTQARIGDELGLSQQRVSEILAEVRASIPDTVRADAALLDLERIDMLLSGVMPAAVAGDTAAVRTALAVLERRARMLRLDLDEPLRVSFEKHLDGQGQLVADAIAAALDAAPELSHETRVAMLTAAQCALLGEDPPTVPAAVPPVKEKPDLEARYQEFLAENGLGDEDDLEDDDGDD